MSETSVWPAHVVERNGLRIDVHAQPAVNLALVHNRVPLITELTVTNESDIPLNGLQVAVRLFGSSIFAPPRRLSIWLSRPRGWRCWTTLMHDGKRISLAAHNDLSAIYRLQGARTAQDVDAGTLLDMLGKERTAFVAVGEEAYARRFKRLQRDARTLREETSRLSTLRRTAEVGC